MAKLEQRLDLIRILHFCLQNFVLELSAKTKEELLVVLLSQGKRSLDFARNVLRESGDEQYDPELSMHQEDGQPECCDCSHVLIVFPGPQCNRYSANMLCEHCPYPDACFLFLHISKTDCLRQILTIVSLAGGLPRLWDLPVIISNQKTPLNVPIWLWILGLQNLND